MYESRRSDINYRYLGIGLIDDLASLHRMIGFSGTAFGYHADDGSTYSTQSWHKNLHSLAEVYGEGDTVGCGFDASTKRVYFTKEGIELGKLPTHNLCTVTAIYRKAKQEPN